MKTPTKSPILILALLACLSGTAQATPYLDGVVGFDYYVAGVDPDGFEWVDADLYAEAVVNDSASRSGPLSLAGWLTRGPSPAGAGLEAGYTPIGTIPGFGEVAVYDTVPADDVPPGEYHVHMLLQDDRYPGTWEDQRSLPPTLLWRGGLEAVGPLRLYQYASGWLEVDFDRLDNRRLDGRYTNPVVLRLLATYGFGPASDGLVLCEKSLPGLYAGDSRLSPGFGCHPATAPDGEYTLHLEVAEAGGRGGYSTLTGPDAYFQAGWMQRFYGCSMCFSDAPGGHTVAYYSGSLGLGSLLMLFLPLVRRARAALRPVVAAALILPGALAAAPAGGDYSNAELDQMLAPIALYPDSVLSNVLIAATYPLEVAQAARWARQNPDLEGEDAVEAVAGRNWDESVKALVAFPELLERMDEDLEWTASLGEAFLAQDAQVMDRIQVLRRRADDAGYLDRAEHVEVVREREVIYIEPAVARRVYIPYYDPWVVYGSWWWPAYPPYAWSFWAGHPVAWYARYHAPFYWGAWVQVWPGFHFTAFNWHRHHVVVVPHHHRAHVHYRARDIARHDAARHWRHAGEHRRQVEYRHQRLTHRSDDRRAQRRSTVERGNYRERGRRMDVDGPPRQSPRLSGAQRGSRPEQARDPRAVRRGHRESGASTPPASSRYAPRVESRAERAPGSPAGARQAPRRPPPQARPAEPADQGSPPARPERGADSRRTPRDRGGDSNRRESRR